MRVSNQTLLYNAKDAAATKIIAEGVFPEIAQLGQQDTYQHTLSLFGPLSYMMTRGVRVDLEALADLKKKCEIALTNYQIELNQLAGRPLKFASTQDCQRYFYGEKGVAPYTKRNPKGGTSITCDDKAIQRLAKGTSSRAGFKEAKIIQRMRHLAKLKGTYLDIVFDKDNRLRCSYNPRGTRFGRLSSSKTIFSTGMNMQNLPPAFMNFLVADPDCIFINLDKRQAEWVVVAYASGDASMIHAIESGVDTHAYTASEMFKVPIDIVEREHKIIKVESDPDKIKDLRKGMEFLQPYMSQWLPRVTSLRQCGKKSNHGLNYDETARMFSFINEITEKEASAIINFYHRTYPGIKIWYDYIKRRLSTDRTLENCFGRRYTFRDRWGPDLFKSAYSYIPQSTVGELVNRAMVETYNDTSIVTNQLEIMMQVHDNIVLQMPSNNVRQLIVCVRRVEGYLNPDLHIAGRTFRIATDMKVGFNLGQMHEVNLSANDDALEAEIQGCLDEQTTPQ